MALSQNEPNAIVCCEDSQIYGLSGLCSLPKVRIYHMHNLMHTDYERYSYCSIDLNLVAKITFCWSFS